MDIVIHLIDGSATVLSCPEPIGAGELKVRLRGERGIPVEDMALYLAGRALGASETLHESAHLYLVVQTVGKIGDNYVACGGFGSYCVCAPCEKRYNALVSKVDMDKRRDYLVCAGPPPARRPASPTVYPHRCRLTHTLPAPPRAHAPYIPQRHGL
jgi:hypothetical protein